MKQFNRWNMMLSIMTIFMLIACGGDNENDPIGANNQKEEKEFFIDKAELTISISDKQSISFNKSNKGTVSLKVEDDFVASASVDATSNSIIVRANHVGKTILHISYNSFKETCIINCIPNNDYIGYTIIDYGISQKELISAIKGLNDITIDKQDGDYIYCSQKVKWYNIDVKYVFENDKLKSIYKSIKPNADVEASLILNCLEEYYEYVETKSSYKEQGATTSESIEITITPYLYRYPQKGYIEYHKEKNYYKKSKKTNISHYIIYRKD